MLTYYLLAVNVFSFALMGIDKSNARRSKQRIAEKVLFFSAILGGSIGTIAGMALFRHKTKHLTFVIGLPIILLLQLITALWLTY